LLSHPFDVIQRRIIFTGDSLYYELAALGFASKARLAHPATRKCELRCRREAQRRIIPDALGEFSFHVQPFSICWTDDAP
jgi:hypothetical protein